MTHRPKGPATARGLLQTPAIALVWFADRFISGKVKCRAGSRKKCKVGESASSTFSSSLLAAPGPVSLAAGYHPGLSLSHSGPAAPGRALSSPYPASPPSQTHWC